MPSSTRLLWIDVLRTAAILGMIVYHTAYDLQFFYNWNLDVTTGMWKIFQISIASLFLWVSGISAGFWTRTDAFQKGWKRGWFILSAAMLVSLATALIDPSTWVRFGILHLIALSAFILPFLRRLHPAFIAVLGVACIALAPFDLMPRVVSVDYVPPIPWMGPVLLGFAVGIPLAKRTTTISARPGQYARPGMGTLVNILVWPGRHSLAIYLVHQPVILAVLWITS
jgi:uncharacterized membrane protein